MKLSRLPFSGAWVVSVALGVISSCKSGPKVGDACSTATAVCKGSDAVLYCTPQGSFALATCRGPKGCARENGVLACDSGVAVAGDGCATEDTAACASDGKAALLCKSNTFVLAETCKGRLACRSEGDTISCDNDVAGIGDPCRREGDYACTPDKLIVLKCKSSVMQPARACRGPQGCSVIEHRLEHTVDVDCDDSLAQQDDPCELAGDEACSLDGKALLRCKAAKYVVARACGGRGCLVEGAHRVSCDRETPMPNVAHGKRKKSH